MLVGLLLAACGAAPPPPDPIPHGADRVTLVAWTLPAGWGEGGVPGSVSFGTGGRAVAWLQLRPTPGGLAGVRAVEARSYRNTLEDATLGGRPALRVTAAPLGMSQGWTSWFAENARGEVFEVRSDDPAPGEALVASLRLLPVPPVPPDARFPVSGRVLEFTGNCMPPTPCTPTPVAAEVHVRALGVDGADLGVVGRVTSDAAGAYAFDLPPGRYSVVPVVGGAEECRQSGPLGPCAVAVFDGPVAFDVVLDHAAW